MIVNAWTGVLFADVPHFAMLPDATLGCVSVCVHLNFSERQLPFIGILENILELNLLRFFKVYVNNFCLKCINLGIFLPSLFLCYLQFWCAVVKASVIYEAFPCKSTDARGEIAFANATHLMFLIYKGVDENNILKCSDEWVHVYAYKLRT